MQSSTRKFIIIATFTSILAIYLTQIAHCQVPTNTSSSSLSNQVTATSDAINTTAIFGTQAKIISSLTSTSSPSNTSSTNTTADQSGETTPLQGSASYSPHIHGREEHRTDQQASNNNKVPPLQKQQAPDSVNLTESVQAATPSTNVARSTPVLRPSIEEVASELSKKYLNLENGTRRHRTHPQVNQQSRPLSHTDTEPPSSSSSLSMEAEQEIQQPSSLNDQQTTITTNGTSTLSSGHSSGSAGGGGGGGSLFDDDHHYLSIDTTSSRPAAQPNNTKKFNRAHRQHPRRGGGGARLARLHLTEEDIELQQCQQYLQIHGPTSSTGASDIDRLSNSINNPHLPCSCESRRHFALMNDDGGQQILHSSFGSIWLNCDNIQLIGNQLYNPSYDNNNNYSAPDNNGQARSNGLNHNNHEESNYLTQFSQRNAGLQSILSQKFHYLQLYHLKAIDLSNNRLRNIKLDAFHGLENSIEYLNLANNLLGDSRASFAGRGASAGGGAANNSTAQNEENNGKSIFYNDELNRLKRLTWLSLSNNQINQLSADIFVKNSANINSNNIHLKPGQQIISGPPAAGLSAATGSQQQDSLLGANGREQTIYSKLVQLDLSDNLLKFVPSDSIHLLNKLRILKLNRNRIIQLDQLSKFPHALEYLDLSENLISSIRHCDLIDLPNLIELNLSHNQLQQLDQTAFISATLSHHQHGQPSFTNPSSSLLAPHNTSPINQVQHEQEGSSLGHRSTSEVVGGDADGSKSAGVASGLGSHGNGDGRRSFIPLDQDDNINDRNDIKSNELLKRRRRRRRSTSQLLNIDEELEMIESAPDEEVSGADLDADESLLTAVRNRFRSAQSISEELNTAPPPPSQFNSTLKLNLSYNFLENIPGDSLVKFTNLQSLDLSFNRIRGLDSNYLCSIYNLVDNLRSIDLSGNLLSLSSSGGDIANQRHLNRLFGCLQRLEKLTLSTNRLGVHETADTRRDSSKNTDFIQILDDDVHQSSSDNHQHQDSSASINSRLVIKLGDSFGGKHMNTLDLSDNQLRHMPLIDQINQQLTVTMANGGGGQSNNNVSANMMTTAPNQTQLNQWISSRIYLEVLNLNYNHIERLEMQDFDDLFNLRQLHLDFNKLTNLPLKLMRRFTSLDKLSLAGNKLTSLDPLNELIERSVRTLRTLNLANNRLMEWPPMTKQLISTTNADQATNYNTNHLLNPMLMMKQQNNDGSGGGHDEQAIGGAFGGGGESRHQQKQMLLEFALEELNLEGNLLTSVNVTSLFDQLVHMRSLKRLNLSFNLLNKIKSEWFKFANRNLQHLLLAGNKINNIDLGAFALNQVNELITLDLDYNLLKELRRKTFDSMPKLREINLGHNLIHTINSETFHQMNSLQVLKLNNNKLTSWKCEYFAHLCNSVSGQINVDLTTLILSSTSSSRSQSSLSNSGDSMNSQQAGQSSSSPTSQTQQPSPVSALIELDLSHNSLSQLRANSISVHTKLVKLDLSHNKLSFIPHDLFKATATTTTTTSSASSNGRQVHLVSSLKYLNLAFNRIQTVENINFRPLRNLISLDLSHNELQTLGVDVVLMDLKNVQHREQSHRNIIISNNLTNLLVDEQEPQATSNRTGRSSSFASPSPSTWPGLCRLRHLNLAHNHLTSINQSILSELSPFVSLNLNLSSNLLESESLSQGFYTKISNTLPASKGQSSTGSNGANNNNKNYDLIYTLKLESLDLSYNRLNEYPSTLLENHYSSMESCNLGHNRIQHLPQNSNSMIQIKWLNFEFNPLTRESNELVLFEQKSIRHLNLAATRLYAIQQAISDNIPPPASSLAQVKHRLANQTSQLDLIRSISKPIDAPYLRHLNLSSNQLVWLAANVFDKMHSLQTLDLSNNQLTRLHLLNNQLSHVAITLENLYMGSNLFTNIDSSDFNQLITLRQLDLSNLLSLQKLNCRFLSKLTTLKSLKMFNYPQLRQTLATLLVAYRSHKSSSNERFRRKIQDELITSTIGKHCFLESKPSANGDPSSDQSTTSAAKWFNLEELEVELYNNFDHLDGELDQDESGGDPSGSYHLEQELRQLLGPNTRRLTLMGLNLTSLSDDSLLGITSDELALKISYTSIGQLPLRQIMSSLARRTKLDLDLRNNNIQTIDLESMQWLEELQQIAQATSVHNDQYPALKLASNPFRCDCQTRPLWLWLNQRWDNIEMPQVTDEQIGAASDSPIGNSANYYLKFHPHISQTSDIKCFHPGKLRGKLVQHVNYNELVCKGSNSAGRSPTVVVAAAAAGASSSLPTSSRQAKRRNETTRLADSYYLTPSMGQGGDYLASDSFDDLDDEDYLDATESGRSDVFVKVTRFNRYPFLISNTSSLYFLSHFPSINNLATGQTQERSREADVSMSEGVEGPGGATSSNRMAKRDQNSSPNLAGSPAGSSLDQEQQQDQQVNTRYNKHRPNSQQKHSPFQTLSNLNPLQQLGRSLHSRSGLNHQPSSSSFNTNKQHSFLTESDIMIITVASIAMTIMSFVIMGICMFKYRMDHSDREQILTSQGRMLLAAAAAAAAGHQQPHLFATKARLVVPKKGGSSGNSPPSSSSSSSDSNSKPKSSSSSSSTRRARQQQQQAGHPNGDQYRQRSSSSSNKLRHQQQMARNVAIKTAGGQILVPINAAAFPADHHHQTAGAINNTLVKNPNFLMRSPTIRRMQGIATNASDWFKYTLRVHPNQAAAAAAAAAAATSSGSRRRRLFVRNNGLASGGSQLTTAKLANRFNQHHVIVVDSSKVPVESNNSAATSSRSSTSSSSTRTSPKTVGGSKETIIEQQHHQTSKSTPKSFQASIEHQNGGRMPANMVKALARQLDERHQIINESASSSIFKPNPNGRIGSGYYTREQQVKSMRTFGRDISASGAGVKASHHHHDDEDHDGVPSQLPTIDVDGRFKYQSESQIDSPSTTTAYTTRDSSQVNTRGRNTPTSTVATGQEDIFILVRDTPSQSSFGTKSQSSSRFHHHHHLHHLQHHSDELISPSSGGPTTSGGLTSTAISSTTNTPGTSFCTSTSLLTPDRSRRVADQNSATTNEEDECSRTSSPVAYGFMRSSPSATTTLSSNTLVVDSNNMKSSGHYNFNGNYKHIQRMGNIGESLFYETSTGGGGGSLKELQSSSSANHANAASDNNNNNNNHSGCQPVNPNLKRTNPIASSSTTTTSPPADDHIIISRL